MSSIPGNVRERVRAEAGNRCGYCHCSQRYVLGMLEIDHLVPQARGGSDEESNLWLACRLCNLFRGTQTEAPDPVTGGTVSLFNPRTQCWSDHFAWSSDGTRLMGLTPCGRATVVALQLNHFVAVAVRREWVQAGWQPPQGDSVMSD